MKYHFISNSKFKQNAYDKLNDGVQFDKFKLDGDIPEVESILSSTVVEQKIKYVYEKFNNNMDFLDILFVEDVALYIDGSNDFGTNIKYQIDDLFKHVSKTANIICSIASVDKYGGIAVYQHKLNGTIVEPTEDGYGFDPYFKINASNKTLASYYNKFNIFDFRYGCYWKMIDDYGFDYLNINDIQEWIGGYQHE